jgi:hypothetical protein
MTLPTSEPLPPEDKKSIPPARRRRKGRMILPVGQSERAAFLEELAHRVTPSFDFFVFALLSGMVLGVALLLDSPALYLLAALMAPFMAPVIGCGLASIVGSFRFFMRALGGIGIGSLLVFICGAVAGWAAHLWPKLVLQQAVFHARFSWPDFVVLTLGAGLTTYLLVRAPQSRPLVTSVGLAYEIFLPIGTAGFGLVSGLPGLWPDGLVVFIVHLAWSALIGAMVLALIGLRPLNLFGYTIGSSLALVSIVAVIAISGVGTAMFVKVAVPSPIPTTTHTVTPTRTSTFTVVPPTLTNTPTRTLVPTLTPTITLSPVPTPVWAKINAGQTGGGAFIRSDPSFTAKVVKSLLNGNLVQVLPEAVQAEGSTWVHVKTSDGITGWIVRGLLVTATPSPGW